jgi:hypothetical protein
MASVPRRRAPKAFVPKPPPRPEYKTPPHYQPKAPPSGAVPNPRRPRMVRDISGRFLLDLFRLFPDLPRPAWLHRPSPAPKLTAALPALARVLGGR